jgi:hypothetical protein
MLRLCKIMICCLLLLAVSRPLQAQTKGGQDVSGSLRGFVQNFYDWYLPMAMKNTPVSPWDRALQSKSSIFDPQLAQALREDSAAEAKNAKNGGDHYVGLDVDPFLCSQDPGDRYEVGRISQKGETYWVEIYSVWSGKKGEKPAVVAELRQKDGSWLFVNFHAGVGGDLLTDLKLLREDRRKASKP